MQLKKVDHMTILIQHGPHYSLVKASTGAVPKQLQKLEVNTLFLGIAQLSKQTGSVSTAIFQRNLSDSSTQHRNSNSLG